MEHLDLISLIGSTGFPIAITAYLLIRLEKQKSKNNNTDILDMRKLSIVNGLTPPIDGEKLEYKRCYMLRFSTLKKLEQIKAMHPDIVYVSSIVDMAINHYFHCLCDNG